MADGRMEIKRDESPCTLLSHHESREEAVGIRIGALGEPVERRFAHIALRIVTDLRSWLCPGYHD